MVDPLKHEFKFRKLAQDTYYRKRYLAITADEQIEGKELKRMIQMYMMVMRDLPPDSKRFQALDRILRVNQVRYFRLMVEPPSFNLGSTPNRHRTIASFSPSQCKTKFRFLKQDLVRLMAALKIPEEIKMRNRSWQSGEEVLLRGLYELVHACNQEETGDNVFGGVGSDQSLAYGWFTDHIFDNFKHLVQDNLEWWYLNGFFRKSAQAISRKLNIQTAVAHFIDCNCLPTCVVGGGPAERGANAARWDDTIQRSFYNGWKSVHGLKHQTVDNAYGMTVDMCGPTALRRNDLALFRISDINQRMGEVQAGNPVQYVIFGDSAYKTNLTHCRSYFKIAELIPDYKKWNTAMKRVRISIEWNYGYTASLFTLLQNKRKLRVMAKGDSCARCYTVCTLLRNFYSCLHGNQTAVYFNVRMPRATALECYINQLPMYAYDMEV
jgi:hypothetical protein